MQKSTRSTIRKQPTIRGSPQKITRKVIAINTDEERITQLFEYKQINIQITNMNNDNSLYQKFFTYFNTVPNFLTIFKYVFLPLLIILLTFIKYHNYDKFMCR
jgi:hypothetical protein